jgi:ribosomal protein L7/L12
MDELSAGAAGLAALLLTVTLFRLRSLERRVAAISRLDAKLDALLQHAGVDFNPYGHVPPDVVDALKRGEKIEAIKRYREGTGAGLKDAKDFVEEVQRRAGMGA